MTPTNDRERTDTSTAVEQGQFGAIKIVPEALENSYEVIDDDGNLKAKLWEQNGERRLYLRIRDHDDGRRFNEYAVSLGEREDATGGTS